MADKSPDSFTLVVDANGEPYKFPHPRWDVDACDSNGIQVTDTKTGRVFAFYRPTSWEYMPEKKK